MATLFSLRSLVKPPSRLISSTRQIHLSSPRLALYPNASRQTFDKVVGTKDRVVIVDFYADWCGPCRTIAPVLKQATAEPNTSGSGHPLDLVQIDTETEDGQHLAREYQITALPTVFAFKDGKKVTGFVGALPPPAVQDFIKKM